MAKPQTLQSTNSLLWRNYTTPQSSDDNNIYIKAVNVRDTEITSEICVEGVNGINANVTELSGNSLDDINDFDNPKKVSPKTSALTAVSNTFEYTFPPQSVTIFTVQK